jgi:hypothetical protein
MSLIKESTWFLRKSKSQILQLRWRVFGFTNNLWYTSESLLATKSLVKIRPSNSWDVALPPSKIKLIQVSSATEILRRCMHHNLSHTYTLNIKILFDKFSTQHMINLNMKVNFLSMCSVWQWIAVKMFFFVGGRPPQPPFFLFLSRLSPKSPPFQLTLFTLNDLLTKTANKHRNFSAILYLL